MKKIDPYSEKEDARLKKELEGFKKQMKGWTYQPVESEGNLQFYGWFTLGIGNGFYLQVTRVSDGSPKNIGKWWGKLEHINTNAPFAELPLSKTPTAARDAIIVKAQEVLDSMSKLLDVLRVMVK
jgi:hypothetical protein